MVKPIVSVDSRILCLSRLEAQNPELILREILRSFLGCYVLT